MSSDDLTTRVILARHGEAAYLDSAGAEVSGGILTELGQFQACDLGHKLRAEAVAAVASSELSRARQTAEIAAEILGLRVEVCPGLHEYRLGDEPYDIPTLGRALLDWLAGDLQTRILGGERADKR